MLAAGMAGIQGEYELPEGAEDDVWSLTERERQALGISPLPRNLDEAIRTMEKSDLVAETLGEHVFDFFLRNKRAEFEEYRNQVTPMELTRLLPVSLRLAARASRSDPSTSSLFAKQRARSLIVPPLGGARFPTLAAGIQLSSGRTLDRSARRPEAWTGPSRTASAQVIRPVASRKKVTGSVSTTLGGVPRVCAGTGTRRRSHTAPRRTAAREPRPNGRDAARPGSRRASAWRARARPGPVDRRLLRQGAAQVVTVHDRARRPGVQQILRGDRAARAEHHLRQPAGRERAVHISDDFAEQTCHRAPGPLLGLRPAGAGDLFGVGTVAGDVDMHG